MNAVRKKWNDLSESEQRACYDALAGRPFWHNKDGCPYEVSSREFAGLYAKEQRANAETDALARMSLGDAMTIAMVKCMLDLNAWLFCDSTNDISARRACTACHGKDVVGGV